MRLLQLNLVIKGKDYVGGIAGNAEKEEKNNTIINDCHIEYNENFGGSKITGQNYIGGILGCNNGAIVSNSENRVEVSGSGTVVGGIVGQNTAANTRVYNCYNIGKATSGSEIAGGIVGYNAGSKFDINNCYNAGKVTAQSICGEILGKNDGQESAMSYCYYLKNDPKGNRIGECFKYHSGCQLQG